MSVLQFRCDTCLQSFHTKQRMKSHQAMCTFCPKCNRYMDKRHLDKCTGKVPKHPKILCPKCDRMTGKLSFARHMRTVHGEKDWKVSDHPEVMAEVIERTHFFKCIKVVFTFEGS